MVLERTQTHPPGNQHQKGPVCLWVAEEVIETQQIVEQATLFPLRPPPPHCIAPQHNDMHFPALVNT